MKKLVMTVMSILLIIVGLVGCSNNPENQQEKMLIALNDKYGCSFTADDIINIHEEGNCTIYYFGQKDDMFDDTKVFAVVYDADSNTYIDNYNACKFEEDIIAKVTELTNKECFVQVNTINYPLSAENYTTLEEYLSANTGSVVFNVYICDDGTEINTESLKTAYETEFGNTGLVKIEIVDNSIYEAIRNEDFETFYGHADSDKTYVGTLEW
ncbi:MAG: hypothetical protein IJZ79_03160 [Bacilli bacterium]|nr:hypothetical protein [Bacilli bacterium]MBQ8218726.1 hypothetical protein [Bacilli bacterium]